MILKKKKGAKTMNAFLFFTFRPVKKDRCTPSAGEALRSGFKSGFEDPFDSG